MLRSVTLTEVSYEADPLPDMIAVDPSLTSTGLCVVRDKRMFVGLLKSPPKLGTGLNRLNWFHQTWADILAELPGVPVVIEDYSFSSVGRQHATGELGGVYRLGAFRAGRKLVQLTPTQVKKFAAGTGNAKKPMIMKEVFKRWAVDLNSEDMADAVAIAMFFGYGESYMQGHGRQMTAAMKDVITKAIKEKRFDGEVILTPRKRVRQNSLQPVSLSC